jgi:hypothetical protein
MIGSGMPISQRRPPFIIVNLQDRIILTTVMPVGGSRRLPYG